MAWSYTPGNVGTVDRDWVRLQIGDTDTNDQLLSNEEIDGVLTREVRRDRAAVRCAEEIAAKFSRFGSQEVSRAYSQLANRLAEYLQISSGTWSYSGDPNSSDLDKIRFLIGDTDPQSQRLNNAEITEALQDEPRVEFAAANCCESIAAKIRPRGEGDARRADIATIDRLKELADRLRMRGRVATGTWSYSGNPASSARDMVRFLIGDIELGDQQVNNAEIDAILAVEARPHFAAARCARTLSINYALHRKAEKAQYYGTLAASLERSAEIHAGTWSYSGDPNASNLDKVRFLVGDVNPDTKLLNNAEITEVLQDEPRVHFAAARCAEALAARFASQSDAGAQSVRSARYLELAKRLREQAESVQTGSWSYSSSDLEITRNWVRLRIGDADTNHQLLNDAELDSFIALAPSREAAAAAAAKSLAARYGSGGDQTRSKHFTALADAVSAEGGLDYL